MTVANRVEDVKELVQSRGKLREDDEIALKVTVDLIVRAFVENSRQLQDIERRVRSGTNTEPRAVVGASLFAGPLPKCGHHHHNESTSPAGAEDLIGDKIDELLSPSSLHDMVPTIIKTSTTVYNKVVNRAKEEGEEMPENVKSYVRRECLMNSAKQEIVARARKWLQGRNQSSSTEGGTYANPLALKRSPVCEVDGTHPLDRLNSATIESLMRNGWAVQDGWK
ncbi:hypothetical protein Pmar_PMAR011847 [Perkinsus marinus ATCC 50983]|uniref:Uncharacterized protein n=1 Tax=Perkinsus marinus (strain ATCC 50983 / TXsc) TaxID=423536 RepID=C5LBH7_PERM5|nr:hypothetical protein Pmar_PMAR011847 [Perkinsus marinus ATCC 50983]EER05798.1 hypothetical protein Pmar_PMAR011847 [Perkinsus marinus ATCC 50983]|eukprot:XP_002773982.1 hypothetical protein Pmar_PMAR011847 [Perkinsus marinus ATCC 50983]